MGAKRDSSDSPVTQAERFIHSPFLLPPSPTRARTLSDSFVHRPNHPPDRSNSVSNLQQHPPTPTSPIYLQNPLFQTRGAMFRSRSVAPSTQPLTGMSRCRVCFRKFFAFLVSNVGLCVLVVAYSFGGAIMFVKVEEPFEVKTTNTVNELRSRTINNLWNITYHYNIFQNERWLNEVSMQLKNFQRGLMNATKDGYEGPTTSVGRKQWSFSGAFLFSLTVISTIGYGNISPRTVKGKLLTIIYAIVGIPLMLLYLTNIGDILARSFRYVYGRLCSCKQDPKAIFAVAAAAAAAAERRQLRSGCYTGGCVGGGCGGGSSGGGGQHRYNVQRNISSASGTMCSTPNIADGLVNASGGYGILPQPDYPGLDISDVVPPPPTSFDLLSRSKEKVRVPITLCLFIMTSYICGGGILFSLWENWDYLDGTYFCFVTLSTIGFGDLVPGASVLESSSSDGKLAICSLYLLAGMALLAMCFKLMQEEVIYKIRLFGRKIGIINDADILDISGEFN